MLELDLRRNPIMVINPGLHNIDKIDVPQFKIDSFENAVKHTNLIEVIENMQKEKITKP